MLKAANSILWSLLLHLNASLEGGQHGDTSSVHEENNIWSVSIRQSNDDDAVTYSTGL